MVALEGRGLPVIGRPLETEPGGAAGRSAVGDELLESGMAARHVIEHAVQHDGQPALAGRLDQRIEVGVVAEPGIDAEMIDRVVAVRGGGEDRTEQESRGAELDRVVEPAGQPAEAVSERSGALGADVRADEAQRIDVPEDCVLDPDGHDGLSMYRLVYPIASSGPSARRRRTAPRSRTGSRAPPPAPVRRRARRSCSGRGRWRC